MASETGSTLIGLAGKGSGHLKVAAFPGRYLQGPGAVSRTGCLVAPFTRRVLLLGGPRALEACGEGIEASLKEEDIALRISVFGGRCTGKEVSLAAEDAREFAAGAIIGVGGGQVLDAAKAVANETASVLVVVPTIASTDAPTSSISVLYTDEGHFSHYLRFPRSPDMVLVDTGVISRAPVRYLVAGMGGALGVSYEAEAAVKSGAINMAGGLPFGSVIQWAVRCRDIILRSGLEAKASAESGSVTPALEEVVEANILLSGIGFESGGLAAAHGIYHGLRAKMPHLGRLLGEVIAFGLLVQLIMEGRTGEELSRLISFYRLAGLPCNSRELGVGGGALEGIAEAACRAGTTGNMPFRVDPPMILGAMAKLDAMT